MNEGQDLWVAHPSWRNRWDVVAKLEGGGQGEAVRARRREDGVDAFLKSIKARRDPERRARFSREATAYDTSLALGVPRLVESNAHLHRNPEIEPYIATEFIPGPTIRAWRASAGRVDLSTVLPTAVRLVGILRDCHAQGFVHRDVKPDNIILRDGDPAEPWLLDFGLNYHEEQTATFATEAGQELGNRFLRLPELSAGSRSKQDARSDLTFAAGILFYLLTGRHPDVLQDGEGRLPHQREEGLGLLRGVGGSRDARLAAFFDEAFMPNLSGRFPTAELMLVALGRLTSEDTPRSTLDDKVQAIRELVDTTPARRAREATRRFAEAIDRVEKVRLGVAARFPGAFNIGATGYSLTAEAGSYVLLWFRPVDGRPFLATRVEARDIGDELLVRLSGETIHRTQIERPVYGEDFELAVSEYFVAQLLRVLSDPDVPTSGVDPFGNPTV